MANNLLSKIQDEYLTCQICKGFYTKPKALPCLHTFCFDCLERYIRLNLSRHLPCPMCRKKFKVPRKGVDTFPSNHLVNGISGLLENQPFYLTGARENCAQLGMASGNNSTNARGEDAHIVVVTGLNQGGNGNGVGVLPVQNGCSEGMPRVMIRHISVLSTDGIASGGNSSQMTPVEQSQDLSPVPNSVLQENAGIGQAATCSSQNNNVASLHCNNTPGSAPHSTTIAYWVDSNIREPDFLHQFGQYGAGMADFTNPLSIATSTKGEVIVADMRENRIIAHDRNGKFSISFQCYEEIRDIAFMENGVIAAAVAYSESHAVQCYSMTGEPVKAFKKPSIYDLPHGIAVNKLDQIILTMLDSGDICIANDKGEETTEQHVVGKIYNSNLLKTPMYVATDNSHNILVSDSENHAIRVFDKGGKFLFTFGAKDGNAGDLNNPRGLCTDYKDNIIVADSGHQAVKLFNPKGKYTRTLIQYPRAHEAGFTIFPIDVSVRNFELFVLVVGPYFSQVRVYTYRLQTPVEDVPSMVCALM